MRREPPLGGLASSGSSGQKRFTLSLRTCPKTKPSLFSSVLVKLIQIKASEDDGLSS